MSEETGDAAEGGEEQAKKGGKLKLIVIALVALLVLGGGGAGAAYFLGFFGGGEPPAAESHAGGEEAEHAEAAAHDGEHGESQGGEQDAGHGGEDHGDAGIISMVYVDLPDLLVNLQSESRRARYLKLRVALEVSGAQTAESIKTLTPRIMDSFQLYLRALTAEDVKGAVGMQRLKAEMLARINNAVSPIRVSDLLFKEMLVQ